MKLTPLAEHPVYLWLQKPREYNDIHKFKNVFPLFQEQPLNPRDNLLILSHINYYLSTILSKHSGSFENAYYSSLNKDSELSVVFSIYQELYKTDKKQKSVIWDSHIVVQLDQIKIMQDFFDENFPHIIKQASYRSAAMKFIQQTKLEKINNIRDHKNFHKHIETFKGVFERYKMTPAWTDVIAVNPSLFNAQLAINYGYEFKSHELFAIFSNIQQQMTGYHSISDSDIDPLAEIYVKLLSNSKFFKHSIAPTKDVQHAIAKFLKTSIKENSYSNADKFANAVIKHPSYNYLHLENQLQKNTNLRIMGKPFLKPEEQEQCNLAFQATKNQAKKRSKI